ncbi:hypothetical protein [Streptomyces sp. NPDC005385]|uniref:hypothetical protein n=1 Tax=Streptomyces sp. NPDC005385 TaxID=3157039 RepID=UPI0033A1DB0D
MSIYVPEFSIEANDPYYVFEAAHNYDDGGVAIALYVSQSGIPAIDPQDIVDYIKGLLDGSPDLLTAIAHRLAVTSSAV